MSNSLWQQNHCLTSMLKRSLLLATSALCRQPELMAYNTTASLDMLTCIEYAEFGKSPEGFGQFSGSKSDSNYLDVNFKVVKKCDSKDF